jgi:hypothetical protein
MPTAVFQPAPAARSRVMVRLRAAGVRTGHGVHLEQGRRQCEQPAGGPYGALQVSAAGGGPFGGGARGPLPVVDGHVQ